MAQCTKCHKTCYPDKPCPCCQKKKSTVHKNEKPSTALTEAERIRRLKNLKSGDKFAYKNVGFGMVSYEKADDKVWRKGGNLFTSCFDRMDGMRWNGQTWEFDGGLGMKTLIVLLEDVPEGQLSE